jgi:hypothetical protein
MPVVFTFKTDANAAASVNGDLMVIRDTTLSTVDLFNPAVDNDAAIIGVLMDKNNALLISQFAGLVRYDYDYWTWTTALIPLLDNGEDVPNPNAQGYNEFTDDTILFIASVGSIAPVLKTWSAHVPSTWKLIRSQANPALHDIYLIT